MFLRILFLKDNRRYFFFKKNLKSSYYCLPKNRKIRVFDSIYDESFPLNIPFHTLRVLFEFTVQKRRIKNSAFRMRTFERRVPSLHSIH